MTPRIVYQFSCGAASAVATKLALAEYGATHDMQIINAFLANEEADNRRFAQDCESWFGRPITVLRDEKYGAVQLSRSAYPQRKSVRFEKIPNVLAIEEPPPQCSEPHQVILAGKGVVGPGRWILRRPRHGLTAFQAPDGVHDETRAWLIK